MALTPERRAYAEKRVARLSNKIDTLTAKIASYGNRQVTAEECKEAELLLKQRRSSVTARKRWLKELTDGGNYGRS